MNSDILIRMANQIGSFFEGMPDRAEALQDVASHIKRFWAPSMRRDLLARIDGGHAVEHRDRVRGNCGERRQAHRDPALEIEPRSVPRTDDHAGLGLPVALAQRPVVVRAAVLDREEPPTAVVDTDLLPAGFDQPHLARRQRADLDPRHYSSTSPAQDRDLRVQISIARTSLKASASRPLSSSLTSLTRGPARCSRFPTPREAGFRATCAAPPSARQVRESRT